MAIPLNFVLGMPPTSWTTKSVVENSMPTAMITPCKPNFKTGLQLFGLDQAPGYAEYTKILKGLGFEIPQGGVHGNTGIKVAFVADSFPTDTFTNEYGESFLDKFTQMASSGLAEMSQFLGASTATEAMSNLASAMGPDSFMGKAAGGMASGASKMKSKLDTASRSGKAGAGVASKLLSVVNAGLSGARVDFPKVWKNSAFEPSYTMTIRLYNPSPGNPELTRKYIVGPLAALLALGLPRGTEDNSGYQWPFLCKIRAKGIYDINAAFITNISVIKGGDQQSIAWNQALSIVDVRLDFGSLFNSILIEQTPTSAGVDRPTLHSYLNVLGGTDSSDSRREIASMYERPAVASTDDKGKKFKKYSSSLLEGHVIPEPKISPNVPKEPSFNATDPAPRASDEDLNKETSLALTGFSDPSFDPTGTGFGSP